MSVIVIRDSRPRGREMALFNEEGLAHGPQRYLTPLWELYLRTCRMIPNTVVYSVALEPKGQPSTPWAKAYIDYIGVNTAEMLAKVARLLQRQPQAAVGYDIEYHLEDDLLHVGLWVPAGVTRADLRKKLRLWDEIEHE